jgi:hypothetical protein
MKQEYKFKITAGIAFLFLLCSVTACKKLIEANPSNSQLLSSSVFTDSATAQAALTGVYSGLISQGGPYSFSISTLPGFSADELQFVGSGSDNYINNAILSNDGGVSQIWTNSYKIIYVANAVMEGVPGASGMSPRFKNQALAECRFIRAFTYFYLVNLYGDVPLIVSTDVSKNTTLGRTPASQVYTQIIEDLKFAKDNLPSDYSISGGTRTRANKWVAAAMLAKVYLYNKNWVDAEAQATELISNTALFELSKDLSKVFTPTSKEAIWQLYNDANGYTWYASKILPNAVSKIPTYFLNPALVADFEAGDTRKDVWTGSVLYNGVTYSYPNKYKSVTLSANAEYYTVLRMAEMYLIRAEARAQRDNVDGAKADISAVRNRAGLGATAANDKASLLLAIEKERRIEFNAEYGHRWFDLKRTGRINQVLGAVKPGWKPDAALYPIPDGERKVNLSLTQNPGYN